MGRAGTMRTIAEMYFLFYMAETILDLYTYIYLPNPTLLSSFMAPKAFINPSSDKSCPRETSHFHDHNLN